jgi:hypothetical protein
MNIGAILVFDPPPDGGAPALSEPQASRLEQLGRGAAGAGRRPGAARIDGRVLLPSARSNQAAVGAGAD